MPSPEIIRTTTETLEHIQQFDAKSLGREIDLGTKLSFVEAIPYAESIIELYKRIPLEILNDLPDGHLNAIKNQSQADLNSFNQILAFDALCLQRFGRSYTTN